MKSIIFLILAFLVLSCNLDDSKSWSLENINYFISIKSNDEKLPIPQGGDWLYEHKEKLQTFEKYLEDSPKKLSENENIIYIKPLGDFTNIQKQALELTREYLSIFYQSKTVILSAESDKIIPPKYKRLKSNINTQLYGPYILDSILIPSKPKNSMAFMAISSKDLYPRDSWSFVFGLAYYNKRVGVTSIYRLQDTTLTKYNFTKCLKRLINVSSHEIGHMFSISHCLNAKCTLNGSNGMFETDASPNRLCSECQKKIYWNLKFDNSKRLLELMAFFKRNKLTIDYGRTIKDYNVFQKSLNSK